MVIEEYFNLMVDAVGYGVIIGMIIGAIVCL